MKCIVLSWIVWTRTYLKKAGLIDSPSRGVFIITSEGSKLLADNPAKINGDFLMKYENFKLFKSPNTNGKEIPATATLEDTPQDVLDSAFKRNYS
jgi:restriction system protein